MREGVADARQRVALVEESEQQQAQADERGRALRAVAHRCREQLDGFGDPVEEEVLLAREVVEDRHRRDVGGFGDLGHGHVVEAPRREQHRRLVGDPLPGLALLELAQGDRCFLRVVPLVHGNTIAATKFE